MNLLENIRGKRTYIAGGLTIASALLLTGVCDMDWKAALIACLIAVQQMYQRAGVKADTQAAAASTKSEVINKVGDMILTALSKDQPKP